MAKDNKKLGMGLSSLLGENKISDLITGDDSSHSIQSISVTKIVAGVYQPRLSFDQDDINDLAESIKDKGILQPLIVRKSPENKSYEIIAGERRFRAAQLAGLKQVPAIVKNLTDTEALEIALIENVQRSDLTAVEEAKGYKRLIDEFSYTNEQIAKKIGKSLSYVTNSLRLLKLPEEVIGMIDNKTISAGHARAIINSSDPIGIANKIAQNGLSVREVEKIARLDKVAIKSGSSVNQKTERVISSMEEELYEITGFPVKISYNPIRNSGSITIKFDDIEEASDMVDRLSQIVENK